MLKPVKKIITESGETRIIPVTVREEKAVQTSSSNRQQGTDERDDERDDERANERDNEDDGEYELHPKLQELLEYFVRDDKFTIASHSELASVKHEVASIKNDLGEIKMMLKVLKSKHNNGKYND